MRTYLVFLAILFSSALQNCTEGCLRCDDQNRCLICDSTQSFSAVDGACQKIEVANCRQMNMNGSCVDCKEDFYLDINVRNCLPVKESAKIQNCSQYNPALACKFCGKDTFLQNGSCQPVTQKVANCEFYSADGTCTACISNYLFVGGSTPCKSITPESNCNQYSTTGCRACKSGYSLNHNAYFDQFSTLKIQEIMNPISTVQSLVNTKFKSCLVEQIQGCSTYESFNKCKTCSSGYFLSNSSCVKNPIATIVNCSVYENATTCIRCKAKHYLSSGACLAVTEVTDCIEYNTAASSSTCIKCVDGKYFNGTECIDRTNSASITGCILVSDTSDTCQTCNQGLKKTTDGLKCLAKIDNCKSYAATVLTTTTLTCTECVNGFYLSTTGTAPTCLTGDVSNCLTYANNSANTCTLCDGLSYLSSGKCILHTPIENCTAYSSSIPNRCDTCKIGTFKFSIEKICAESTPIANCKSYDSGMTNCSECNVGYYLNGGECPRIPFKYGGCKTLTGLLCTSCMNGFAILGSNSLKKCVIFPSYYSSNCDSWTDSMSTTELSVPSLSSTSTYCQTCMQGSFPLRGSPIEAVCVNPTNFELYGFSKMVSNCVRYGMNNSNVPVCMECKSGYYISDYWANIDLNFSTICVQGCPINNSQNVIIVDDIYGVVNICVPIGTLSGQINASGCSKLVRKNITGTRWKFSSDYSIDYSCIATGGNYVSKYNTSVLPVITSYANNALAVSNSSAEYYGFEIVSTGFRPQVFNYYGLKVNPILLTTISPQTSLTHCLVYYQPKGSLYVAGGAKSGAYKTPDPNSYSCLKCQNGYAPTFTVTGNTGNSAIPICQKISTTKCTSSAIVLGGLPHYLNSVISCYQCTDTTFPTIQMEIFGENSDATNGQLIAYTPPIVSTGNALKPYGFTCDAKPSIVSKALTAPSAGDTVTNCGFFGTLSTVLTLNEEPATAYSHCLACLTGHYPIHGLSSETAASIFASASHAPKFIVTECITSSNCDTNAVNRPFNSCGKCSIAQDNNPSPVYYAYNDLTLINCQRSKTRNCFVLSFSATLTTSDNDCSLCMAGYYLNGSGFCDKLTAPNQLNSATFSTTYYFNSPLIDSGSMSVVSNREWIRLHYLLSFAAVPYGVSECDPGFVRFPVSKYLPIFCVISSLEQPVTLPAGSKYINGCIKYRAVITGNNNQNNFVCEACKNELLITSNGMACVAKINNCVVADSTTTTHCSECDSGFKNINNSCSSGTIDKCVTHLPTESSSGSSLTCKVCEQGYSLTSSSLACIEGSLANCGVYQQGSTFACQSCKKDYMLIQLPNSVQYCYPLSGYFSNCNLSSDFGTSSIKCDSCYSRKGTFLAPTLVQISTTPYQPRDVCLPFKNVENCNEYETSNTAVQNNSLKCVGCVDGYYWSSSQNSCLKRTVTIAGCVTYTKNDQTCQVCNESTFLESGICSLFPNGLPKCATYTDLTTCASCISGYYLKDGVCTASATTITECSEYSDDNVCSKCNVNFFLESATSCVAAVAANCLTYTSSTVCATCLPTYIIQDNANDATIKDCAIKSIANCVQRDSTPEQNCAVCDAAYYVNAGACTSVTLVIPNCKVYESENTCSQCNHGFTLLFDKSACSAELFTINDDQNCSDSFVFENAGCSQCKPGYYFVNGICTTCSENSISLGCQACDPTDNFKCLWCVPGGTYYMNSDRICVKKVVIPPTPVEPPITISAIVYKTLLLYVMTYILA